MEPVDGLHENKSRYVKIPTMKVKNYTVIKYQDADGVWIGRVLELQGCHSYGETVGELERNLEEAVALCLEDDDIVERKVLVEKQEFTVDG